MAFFIRTLAYVVASPLIIGTTCLAQPIGPKDCPPGHHFRHAHHRDAYTKTDGTQYKASNVDASCPENTKGYDFWNSKFKNTRPKTWPNGTEKTKTWNLSEQERALDALSEIPEVLWNKNLNGIFRMHRSIEHPNPASTNNSEIVLYDTAFTKPNDLTRIFSHELAHQYIRKIGPSDFDDYRKATGWLNIAKRGEDAVFVTLRENFVAPDGKISPQEDLANNIEFYLSDGKTLKNKTVEAFNWIQKHFGPRFKLEKGKHQ